MISYINISFQGLGNIDRYIVDYQKNILIHNGDGHVLSDDNIHDLMGYILSFENVKSSNNYLDIEEYYIEIVSDSGTSVLKGRGNYPANYGAFKSFLEGLC